MVHLGPFLNKTGALWWQMEGILPKFVWHFGANGGILPKFGGHFAQNLGHFAPAGGGGMAPLAPLPQLDQPLPGVLLVLLQMVSNISKGRALIFPYYTLNKKSLNEWGYFLVTVLHSKVLVQWLNFHSATQKKKGYRNSTPRSTIWLSIIWYP